MLRKTKHLFKLKINSNGKLKINIMTNEELEDEIYTLYLQNNTEKVDFDKAFKFGIECAIDHLTELNLLPIQDVRESKPKCNFCNDTGTDPLSEETHFVCVMCK